MSKVTVTEDEIIIKCDCGVITTLSQDESGKIIHDSYLPKNFKGKKPDGNGKLDESGNTVGKPDESGKPNKENKKKEKFFIWEFTS
jgi:hypothetical protein